MEQKDLEKTKFSVGDEVEYIGDDGRRKKKGKKYEK